MTDVSSAATAAAATVEEGTLAGGIFYRHWPVASPRGVALLVHGLGEHSGRYQHVAAALGSRGIAALAPDHVGHGRSPGDRCYVRRISDYFAPLDALRATIDSRYPGLPCFIIGHSLGGLITGSYLLERPERFSGAAFSGAAFEIPERPGALAVFFYRLLAAVLPRLGALQLDARQISRDPQVVQAYQEDPLVYGGKIPVGLLVALLDATRRLAEQRQEITLPVLVMHGAGDVMTPPGGSERFHSGVGSADRTLRVYPELYHEIFNEPEQQQVLGDLLDWLDAHLASA